MPVWLDTRGNSVLSVAICDRCNRKMAYVDLFPDPNFPGMRVCKEDLDQFDPWRLPALQTENIALRFPRPDQPLYGPNNATDNLISTQGAPNGSPNGAPLGAASGGQVPLSNTQYDNLFIQGQPNGIPGGTGDVALGGGGVGNAIPVTKITNITPVTGPQAGGTTITITGTNFVTATAVRFSGVLGTSLNIVSNTSLTVVTPAYPTTGSVDVAVVSPENTAVWYSAFKYT